MLVLQVIILKALAQQDPAVSQYMFNQLLINPAYAGSHPYYNATVLHRQQWTGYEGAPRTSVLSADGPLRTSNSSVGFLATYDRLGVTKQSDIYAYYSYHLPLTSELKLSMGMRGGFTYHRADFSEIRAWDPEDPSFGNGIKDDYLPNLGAGLYLHSNKLYAGIASPHIVNYKSESFLGVDNKKNYHLIRHYYIHGGYVFDKNEDVIFKPNFLLRYVNNAPLQADLNLNVLFKQLVWVGASYRTGDAVVGLLEVQPTKNIRIGYAYDLSINKIRRYNGGSHEFMFAFDFGQQVIKMKSPRYF
jgi:type IX secretion system PorP/SprF family membrane protein